MMQYTSLLATRKCHWN